jgi:hypothetical protein
MTMASTITPASARAWDIVFVAAARVRKIADIVNLNLISTSINTVTASETHIVMKVNKKKMKKFDGLYLKPPRK